MFMVQMDLHPNSTQNFYPTNRRGESNLYNRMGVIKCLTFEYKDVYAYYKSDLVNSFNDYNPVYSLDQGRLAKTLCLVGITVKEGLEEELNNLLVELGI